MSEKFQNKYRIPSARWQSWDYRWNAAYFVTLCTRNRYNFFGNIHDGKMMLSHVGIIADILWHEITNHAKNVELGAFVVMPNHVHGIIIINDTATVETTHALSIQHPLYKPDTPGHQRFQHQGKNSLSAIVGSYKSAVSKHAHRLGFTFSWQARFHDHVIRDNESYNRISDYILTNPSTWKEDKFFNDNPC
jgi:REP element-mobilizing transposase RayT